MKLVRSLTRKTRPLGIVHSCPGLQWRHTGMPPAEHMYWMSQVPANGGQIWHSLTGIPDTIRDKRILKTVMTLNEMIIKVEPYIEDAVPVSQVAILWVDRQSMKGWYASDGRSMEGWADGLSNQQIPYEIIQASDVTYGLLQRYKVLIIPEGFQYTHEIIGSITAYLEQGGSVVFEGMLPKEYPELMDLAGIESDVYESQMLVASYLRFADGDNSTVINYANEHMKIALEVTFGPVAPIFTFKTDEEVIQPVSSRYRIASPH